MNYGRARGVAGIGCDVENHVDNSERNNSLK